MSKELCLHREKHPNKPCAKIEVLKERYFCTVSGLPDDCEQFNPSDVLEEALDVVRKMANSKQLNQIHNDGNVFVIPAGTKTKAQVLLPKLEAIIKEKP